MDKQMWKELGDEDGQKEKIHRDSLGTTLKNIKSENARRW